MEVGSGLGGSNDDTVYVAVGKEVKKNKQILLWALSEFEGSKFCILHVNIPRENVHGVLEKYTRICVEKGVQAENLFAENISIKHGIVDLISCYCIKKLVMGAAGNRLFPRKITKIESHKAIYVRDHSQDFCKIWFVFKGQLIHKRSNSHGINDDIISLLNQGSPNIKVGQFSSSKPTSDMESKKDHPLKNVNLNMVIGLFSSSKPKADLESKKDQPLKNVSPNMVIGHSSSSKSKADMEIKKDQPLKNVSPNMVIGHSSSSKSKADMEIKKDQPLKNVSPNMVIGHSSSSNSKADMEIKKDQPLKNVSPNMVIGHSSSSNSKADMEIKKDQPLKNVSPNMVIGHSSSSNSKADMEIKKDQPLKNVSPNMVIGQCSSSKPKADMESKKDQPLENVSPYMVTGQSSSSEPKVATEIMMVQPIKDILPERSKNNGTKLNENPRTEAAGDVSPNSFYISRQIDEEFKQKIEFEETLTRVSEEVEKLKQNLNEVRENMQELKTKVNLLQNESDFAESSQTLIPQICNEISCAKIEDSRTNFDQSLNIMESDHVISDGGINISLFQVDPEENCQIPESLQCDPIYQEVMQDPVLATESLNNETEQTIIPVLENVNKSQNQYWRPIATAVILIGTGAALRSVIRAWRQQP